MDLSRFKTDTSLEDEGVWTSIDASSDAEIRIARIGNRRYRDAMARRLKPYRRALRAGTLDESVTERITAEVLAETVLLDWRGLTIGADALPYSRDTARELLLNPAYRDFRDLVVELAGELDLYRERDLEDAEKKLRAVVRWQFDWGERVDFLNALAAKSGEQPAALANRPELFEDLHAVAEGFATLSAGRTLSIGLADAVPNPISLAETAAYCRLFRIADTAEFCRLIRVMDGAYLERVRQRRSARSGSPQDS